jgi:hypothetical protein
MMLCLFGFHLLNKAVTKVYRPHPARRVWQVNVLWIQDRFPGRC